MRKGTTSSMGEPADVPGAGQKKKKFIMVVDGNPKDALTTSMILQNFGYSVTTVKSAEEALEFLSIAVPSLVITEFILPGMNGIVLMDRMRRDPVVSKVPVVVQTSHPDPSGRDRCVQAGCYPLSQKAGDGRGPVPRCPGDPRADTAEERACLHVPESFGRRHGDRRRVRDRDLGAGHVRQDTASPAPGVEAYGKLQP